MRVGIITITDGQNYGNRLQNYALQTVLHNLGLDVETLQRRTSRDRSFCQNIVFFIKQIVKKVIGRKDTQFARICRGRRFNSFNRKFIVFSSYELCNNVAPKNLSDKYDYFICGSDQIWNARFDIVKEDIKNNLAFFAREEQRIAYAASFGTKDVAYGYENLFRDELKKFKSIGVREEEGKRLVNELCNRKDAKVVIDPTLLLTQEQWKRIEKKPKYIKEGERFIVSYVISDNNKKLNDCIYDISNQFNARIIILDVEFLADDRVLNQDFFCTMPNEFIWLISHAECVLTDSYHASIFSILFHKPFICYKRKATEVGNDMGSRIENLLKMFDLVDFLDDIDEPIKRPRQYDEKNVEFIQERQREIALLFLKDAIGI